MKNLLLSLMALSAVKAQAKEINDIPDLGKHQQIFVVQKNVNPQNLAVVYTKVDDKCRFVTDPSNRDEPVFDFYWRMDGRDYKAMNPFFKNEFHKRMSFVPGGADRATHFQLDANDLKEVNTDIRDPRLDVVASSGEKGCDVQAYITLGPSDQNERIRLDSIYGEGRAFPPKIYSITLKGEVVDANGKGTGKTVSRKYDGN